MANKGLKSYTKQLTTTVGSVGKVNINLCPNDANLIMELPLLKTVGLCPIELGLIYNHQNKDTYSPFGNGMRLNLFNKITYSNSKYHFENADGTTDSYTVGINNSETNCKVIVEEQVNSNNVYAIPGGGIVGVTQLYKLVDKVGNYQKYEALNSEYPSIIVMKNGDTYSITNSSSSFSISNTDGNDVVTAVFDGNYITRINYHRNNQLLCYLVLSYTSSKLTGIELYKEGVCISKTIISYTSALITLKDNISKHEIKYTLSNNKVTSISEYYLEKLEKTTSISYSGNITTITDNENRKTYLLFDSEGFPLFVMDNEKNVVKFQYDKTTKKLVSQSSVINVKNKLTNLFPSNNINNFTTNGVTLSAQTISTGSFFYDCVGSTAYKVTGSGTLTYSVSTQGLATDNITLAIFGKQEKAYSSTSYVEVELGLNYGVYKTEVFKKTVVDDNFDLLTLGIRAVESYDSITVTIRLVGNQTIVLGGLQVLQKDFGSFYKYDSYGNLLETSLGSGTVGNSYSNNMISSTVGIDSTSYDFEYDSKGNLTKSKAAYDVKIENTYDESTNQIKKQKITNGKNDKIIEVNKTYDSNGNLLTLKDELGTTSFTYDSFGKVKSIVNTLSETTSYDYYEHDGLKQIILSSGSNTTNVSYKYDSNHRIDTATLSNGSLYKFTYDDNNDVQTVSLNGKVIYYYKYENGKLKEQKNGTNGDGYSFEYLNGLLDKVYYNDTNGVKTLKFQYQYNSNRQIYRIKNASGTILNEYTYDNDGQVIKTTSPNLDIEYQYDNLGNVNSEKITTASKTLHQSYNSISRSKGSNPEAILAAIQSNPKYMATIFNNTTEIRNNTYAVRAKNYNTGVDVQPTYYKRGIVPCIYAGTTKPISYTFEANTYTNVNECVGFWFYPTATPTINKYLFSIRRQSSLGYGLVAVYMTTSNKLVLEVIDKNNVKHTLLTSDYNVNLNEWNFFNLNWINRDDGQGYTNLCEYALTLNSHTQIYKKENPRLYVEVGSPAVYHIGSLRTETGVSNPLDFQITALMIGLRRCLTNEEVKEYYRVTKDYIIENAVIDNNLYTVDFSNTNLHTTNQSILSQFEIYPLQNNVFSLNGKKPISFSIRNKSYKDKDRTFNFNKINKHYCYVADGSDLKYDFGFNGSGTIMLKVFFEENENKQYVFETQNESGFKFGLYRGDGNKLFIEVDGTSHQTPITCQSSKWYTLAFSYTESIESDSTTTTNDMTMRVYSHDGTTSTNYTVDVVLGHGFHSFTTTIGMKTQKSTIISNLGECETYYPLTGQIEMLATRGAYCEVSTLNTLCSELQDFSKTQEYDDLGMLRKRIVHKCGNIISSNTYSYKSGTQTNHITTHILKEVIRYGSNSVERTYQTDALGRITKITDSIFGNHTYQYDYRGFLVNEDGTSYTYDKNGNILTAGTKTFTYDSVIKDRLVKVNGVNITYSTLNPGLPLTYGNRTFTYEGRRLVNVRDVISSVETKNIKYTYDSFGLLTERKVTHTYTDGRATVTKTTNYYYSGNKLVTEITPEYRNDYLYDENGQLYGFIQNNTTKYFYIRDILQNILGIVDVNGALVVKYEYDAYGKLKSYTGTNINNSMRYKGYYYDVETGLFWCNSRYYNPEWGRWISPDSIEYLDPESINGLNLYAYCNNNPVMNYDPTGHFTILALLIGVGLSLAFEVVEDALDGNGMDHDWKDYLGAGVSGLLGSMGGGLLTQAALSIAGGMFDAWVSGDMEENGFFNSLGSVVLSSAISFGIGAAAKGIASNIKASSLKKMTNHLAKGKLGAMGITAKISSKTTKNTLTKIIYKSNWIGNIIAENVSGSIFGGATSIGYGYLSDSLGFYF